MKEVVGLLESDPEFRKKLDSASEADIRSGKIAQELELVDHNVRTKLDELKRSELERLRGLAMQMYEREHEIDREHMKIAGKYFYKVYKQGRVTYVHLLHTFFRAR